MKPLTRCSVLGFILAELWAAIAFILMLMATWTTVAAVTATSTSTTWANTRQNGISGFNYS